MLRWCLSCARPLLPSVAPSLFTCHRQSSNFFVSSRHPIPHNKLFSHETYSANTATTMCRHITTYHGCKHVVTRLELCTQDHLPSSALFCDNYRIERALTYRLCESSSGGEYCKNTILGQWTDLGPSLLFKLKEEAGELQRQNTAIKAEHNRLETLIPITGPLHQLSMLLRQEQIKDELGEIHCNMADVKLKMKEILDQMDSAKKEIRKSANSLMVKSSVSGAPRGLIPSQPVSTPPVRSRLHRTSSTPYVLHAPTTAQKQSFLDAASTAYHNSPAYHSFSGTSPQKTSPVVYYSPGSNFAQQPFKPLFNPSSSFEGSTATRSFGQYETTPTGGPSPLRKQLDNTTPSYASVSDMTPRKTRRRRSTRKPRSSARAPSSSVRRSGRLSTKSKITYTEPSSNSVSPSPPPSAPSMLPLSQESSRIKLKLRSRHHNAGEEDAEGMDSDQEDDNPRQSSKAAAAADDEDFEYDSAADADEEEENDAYKPDTTEDPTQLSPILSFTRARATKRAAPTQLQSQRSKWRSTTNPSRTIQNQETDHLAQNIRHKLNSHFSNQYMPLQPATSSIQVKSAFEATPTNAAFSAPNANTTSLSPLKPAYPVSMSKAEQVAALQRLYAQVLPKPVKRQKTQMQSQNQAWMLNNPFQQHEMPSLRGGDATAFGAGGMMQHGSNVNVAPLAPSMVAPVVPGMGGWGRGGVEEMIEDDMGWGREEGA